MRSIHLLFLIGSLFSITTLARPWRQGHPCPESIKTVLPGYSYTDETEKLDTFDSMVAVHEALTTCPDITSLDLRVTLMGCSSWPDRFNFPFKLEGGERYPALKELRLEGYRFDERQWETLPLRQSFGWGVFPWYESVTEWLLSGKAREWWKARTVDIDQRNKTNLDLWLEAMDWSHLETLALLDRNLPLEVVPQLASLENLDLSGSDVENIREVLRSLPTNHSLTSLTAVRGGGMLELETVLAYQGQALTKLELRAPEVQSMASPTYNISELRLLPHMAPDLEHLSINVHRNGTWPLETLEAISSNPSLRSADIWFDIVSECRRQDSYPGRYDEEPNLTCLGKDQYKLPYIDQPSSLELFKYMRQRKVGQELTNVTFWVGDWTRAWDGPLYFPDWIEGRRSKVSCSIGNEVGEEGWCVVEVGKEYWNWQKKDPYDVLQ
jgi:hypothetical protein